jgi:hypothetical protein
MHNFDEDEDEYAVAEETADGILEEIEDQQAEQEAEEDAVDTVLNNAIERIEEANVWKLLISQDVIAPGSASNRVVKSVNGQLKKFGLNRLEILLGMKEAHVDKPVVQVESWVDQDEKRALKILAAKVLGRSIASAITSDSSPKLNSIPAPEERKEPRLVQVQASPVQQQRPALRPTPKASSGTPIRKSETPPPQRSTPKGPRRTKVPDDAKVDKGYALPMAGSKPKAMPNAQQQMAMYGMGAQPQMNISTDGSMKNGDTMKSANILSQVIGQLTGGQMMAVNTNAPDGAGDDVNERY